MHNKIEIEKERRIAKQIGKQIGKQIVIEKIYGGSMYERMNSRQKTDDK